MKQYLEDSYMTNIFCNIYKIHLSTFCENPKRSIPDSRFAKIWIFRVPKISELASAGMHYVDILLRKSVKSGCVYF